MNTLPLPPHDSPERVLAQAPRVQTDPDSDRLWKRIFEQGHAVAFDTAAGSLPVAKPHPRAAAEAAAPALPAPARHVRRPPETAPVPAGQGAMRPGAQAGPGEPAQTADRLCADPALLQAAPPSFAGVPAAGDPATGSVASAGRLGTPAGDPTATVPRTAVPAGPAIAAPRPHAPQPRDDAPDASRAPRPAQALPLPDEVVQVFHRDGVVEITIRDLALQPASALRSAIEAARQLAGDTRALRHVTLNGKSIYDAAEQAPPADAGGLGRVSFTC